MQNFTKMELPGFSHQMHFAALPAGANVQQVISALARIPEQERIIFELAAIEGFSSEAVGRILSISTNEVDALKTKSAKQC